MADPGDIEPYNDPYVDELLDLSTFGHNGDAPTLADLPMNDGPSSAVPRSSAAPGDHFEDQSLSWALAGALDAGNEQAGQGGTAGFQTGGGGDGSGFGGGGWNFRQLNDWPPQPAPFTCSCCQVLRDLIHTNGQDFTRLEIHGRLGIVSHAVLEIQQPAATRGGSHAQYHMFDFCYKRLAEVKDFLLQYCFERHQAGFTIVQDPLAFFYKAICVGVRWDDDGDNNNDRRGPNPHHGPSSSTSVPPPPPPPPPPHPPPPHASTHLPHPPTYPPHPPHPHTYPPHPPPACPPHPHPPPPTTRAAARRAAASDTAAGPSRRRTALALQRERAARMTIRDIGMFFHLPIEEAARELMLCPTVVKKICRRGGLSRWPHRKIKSMERKIEDLTERLNASEDPGERAQLESEIERLRKEIDDIRSGTQRDV